MIWRSIPPTLVDSYEYFEAQDYDEEMSAIKYRELLAYARGEPFEASPAMLLGRAFHLMLEYGRSTITLRREAKVFEFDMLSFEPVLDARPKGLNRELSGQLVLPEIRVVMNLRVDGIAGLDVHEWKTSSKLDAAAIDAKMRAFQWRAYLLAFAARRHVYHLCRLNFSKRDELYRLGEYIPIEQFGYSTLREDVLARALKVREWLDTLDVRATEAPV